jgi:hypothetical protein
MSNLSARYKAARLRTVKLSTGDDIQVRPLSKADFLSMGDIPSVLLSEAGLNILNGADKSRQAEIVGEHLPFFTKLLHHALTSCVITPGFKVVLKEPEQCADDEIPLAFVADEDQSAILAAVMSASGASNEAVAAARPFRGEPAAAGGA